MPRSTPIKSTDKGLEIEIEREDDGREEKDSAKENGELVRTVGRSIIHLRLEGGVGKTRENGRKAN